MAIAPAYIVAGSRPWNRAVFDNVISGYPGTWRFVSKPEDLAQQIDSGFNPRFIFFIHWSWKVPPEIIEKYECICFHMTDVPYGRGGSPLQNLILVGHKKTRLTALRMVDDFDAGPVYLKEDLSLEGSAQDIYIRATELSVRMIEQIISDEIEPVPQKGEPVIFRRRTPAESCIENLQNIEAIYDFIRMLDAEDYQYAFFERDGFRYEFTGAVLLDGYITANVSITIMKQGDQ